MNFPFANEPNTATIVCNHIFEGHEDILYVSHDEDDGMWQFLCGKSNHQENDARIVSLYSVYQLDKTVGLLSNMPCGFYAERKSVSDRWFINKAMFNNSVDNMTIFKGSQKWLPLIRILRIMRSIFTI